MRTCFRPAGLGSTWLVRGVVRRGAGWRGRGCAWISGLAFDGFTGFFPADDTCREMFDVGVSELAGQICGFAVGSTIFVAAVGDNQCGFIFWEEFWEIGFLCDEVNGSGDVAGAEGIGAVHIEEGDFSFGDGASEFVERDIGVLFCGEGEGDEGEGERCERLAAVHRDEMLGEVRLGGKKDQRDDP